MTLEKILLFLFKLIYILIEFIPLLILFGVIRSILILKLTIVFFLIVPLDWSWIYYKILNKNKINSKNNLDKSLEKRRFGIVGDFLQKIFKKNSEKEAIKMFIAIVNIINLTILWYILFYKINCKLKK